MAASKKKRAGSPTSRHAPTPAPPADSPITIAPIDQPQVRRQAERLAVLVEQQARYLSQLETKIGDLIDPGPSNCCNDIGQAGKQSMAPFAARLDEIASQLMANNDRFQFMLEHIEF